MVGRAFRPGDKESLNEDALVVPCRPRDRGAGHLGGGADGDEIRAVSGRQHLVGHGILEGDTIRELQGNIFENAKPTGRTRKLAEVKLLAPVEPKKVIAAGLNYKSHIGEQPAAKDVGLFAKLPSSIIGHEENVIYPADATDLHYEAEIVVVIGRRASNITEAQVPQHIFGVTAGNDVSERAWQKQDSVVPRESGRHVRPDGAVAGDRPRLQQPEPDWTPQRQGGAGNEHQAVDLLHPYIVSCVSRYVTLEPGDVIFTGTPGATQAMKPGDTFEVEVQGVGVLRNKIVAASQVRRPGLASEQTGGPQGPHYDGTERKPMRTFLMLAMLTGAWRSLPRRTRFRRPTTSRRRRLMRRRQRAAWPIRS